MYTSREARRPVTDRGLRAWLAAGAVDRGLGEGLTFVASAASARAGKASWILRFRLLGKSKEKVLDRYLELSLREARSLSVRTVRRSSAASTSPPPTKRRRRSSFALRAAAPALATPATHRVLIAPEAQRQVVSWAGEAFEAV